MKMQTDPNITREKDSGIPPFIDFYSKSEIHFGVFSNFFPIGIQLLGVRAPTSEHLYQAFKFLPPSPHLAAQLINKGAPYAVARLARKWEGEENASRSDWHEAKDDIMTAIVCQKALSSKTFRNALLLTRDATIREKTDRDGYWGQDEAGNGLNKLGLILMSIREALKEEGVPGIRTMKNNALASIDKRLRTSHGISLRQSLRLLKAELKKIDLEDSPSTSVDS